MNQTPAFRCVLTEEDRSFVIFPIITISLRIVIISGVCHTIYGCPKYIIGRILSILEFYGRFIVVQNIFSFAVFVKLLFLRQTLLTVVRLFGSHQTQLWIKGVGLYTMRKPILMGFIGRDSFFLKQIFMDLCSFSVCKLKIVDFSSPNNERRIDSV